AAYSALYGLWASAADPPVPPLSAEPPATPMFRSFQKELAKRERALSDFLRGKFDALRLSARTRVGEYLLAAHARRGQPKADDFMLLADPNDINPTMTIRWQAYLERAGRGHHRVFAPWHPFASLPEKDFAASAAEVLPRPVA